MLDAFTRIFLEKLLHKLKFQKIVTAKAFRDSLCMRVEVEAEITVFNA
jgi:hypothetical protein